MKRMQQWVLTIGLALLVSLPASAQEKPVSEEEFEEVKGALQGITESAAEYRTYVDALRKIKLTGYLQAQYRLGQVDNVSYPVGNFSGGTFATYTKSQFQVRRARFKLNYDNTLTQFVLQVDFGAGVFTTKDAYILLIEPWTKSLGMQIGMFDRPFGYEIGYSSSNRESPERARFMQTLFPGEREVGMKLFYAPMEGDFTWLRADLGLFNGSGPTSAEFDNFKDLIGRVGGQFPFGESGAELDLGLSGYYGADRSTVKSLYSPGTLPSGLPGWRVDSSATNVGSGSPRRYAGIDAQFYYDIPSVGGAILRAEYVFGKQPGTNASTTSLSTIPSGPLYQREFTGWYVNYVQNVGSKFQLVVKYDVYDPNTAVAASDFRDQNTSGASGLNVADIAYSTLGVGAIWHWDDYVKFVLYYEFIGNEALTGLSAASPLAVYRENVKDNVLTARVQFKF
jgi:hypothetical protein